MCLIFNCQCFALELATNQIKTGKEDFSKKNTCLYRLLFKIQFSGQLTLSVCVSSFSLSKIHAYNLETNAWEEIATKPHEKIGKFVVLSHLSLTNVFYTLLVLEGKINFIQLYDKISVTYYQKLLVFLSQFFFFSS